jgi:GTP cyclohydrolase I/GTP cyclohydrolase-4
VEKIIRISANGDEQLYHAALECYVDLNPLQAGVHMSRFEEIVNEAVDEVVIGEALKAETLAAHIAERVRERQERPARRGHDPRALPEHKQTPVRARDSGAVHADRYRGRLRAGECGAWSGSRRRA